MNDKRKNYQKRYYLEHKEEMNKNTPMNQARKHRYYESHKEQILVRTRKYYANHKKEHNALTKRHYRNNKKWHSDYKKRYDEEHKLEIQQQKKEYREKNKEKLSKYYQDNKKKISERYKNYAKSEKGRIARSKSHFKRREKLADIIETFTIGEWDKKLDATRGICMGFKCNPHFVGKDNLTVDHTPAISKAPKGFAYTINDVQPLCRSCNCRKKNKI